MPINAKKVFCFDQFFTLNSGGTRTNNGNTTRLLVPKLPSSGTTVKLETGDRWRVGGAGTRVSGVSGAKILVTSGHVGHMKSSARRAIDSHLISNHTVRPKNFTRLSKLSC